MYRLFLCLGLVLSLPLSHAAAQNSESSRANFKNHPPEPQKQHYSAYPTYPNSSLLPAPPPQEKKQEGPTYTGTSTPQGVNNGYSGTPSGREDSSGGRYPGWDQKNV